MACMISMTFGAAFEHDMLQLWHQYLVSLEYPRGQITSLTHAMEDWSYDNKNMEVI